MSGLWRELTTEEEIEFRQWARDNFVVSVDSINSVWHPIVRDECRKMIEEYINKS